MIKNTVGLLVDDLSKYDYTKRITEILHERYNIEIIKPINIKVDICYRNALGVIVSLKCNELKIGTQIALSLADMQLEVDFTSIFVELLRAMAEYINEQYCKTDVDSIYNEYLVKIQGGF